MSFAALGTIKKALHAGGGALLTGLVAALRADNWNLHSLTADQVSPILFLALTTGTAVFAVTNGKQVPAVVVAAEQKVAEVAAEPLAGLADTLTAAIAPHLDAIASAFEAAAAAGTPVPAAAPATPTV